MGSALSSKGPALFQPTTIGFTKLKHRVVFAPCTRFRANRDGVPIVSLVKEYYDQRSKVAGTLLITEATLVAEEAGGAHHVPGIYSDEQVAAWKQVTQAVHDNHSSIILQIWGLGRAAAPDVLAARGHPYLAPSAIPLTGRPEGEPTPREMTASEIKKFVGYFANAARRAVYEAGFDGVEIHGANGYLVNQFLHEVSNTRTDEYGGSIEARGKFGLEVVDAVVKAVGPERTAIRLSPWSTYQDMKLEDPIPQYLEFIASLATLHPKLAYIHVTHPRVSGSNDNHGVPEGASNDQFRRLWSPRPFITCGRYTRDMALEGAQSTGDLVAFGHHFIANPDLPYRLEHNIALTPYDRSTFYTPETPKGYIDYPFSEEFKKERSNL